MLEHLGFDVDVVADGADAVQAAVSTPYRRHPHGLPAPRPRRLPGDRARSADCRSAPRRTPIIAVTGSEAAADRQRCLAAGMDDYLTKPLRLKALHCLDIPVGSARTARQRHRSSRPNRARSTGPRPTPAGPVLDARVVARLERLGAAAGEDLLGQLAALFLADAQTRVGCPAPGTRRRTTPLAVVRSAHTLTGASGNLGATELSRLCGILATDGRAADLVASLGVDRRHRGRARPGALRPRCAGPGRMRILVADDDPTSRLIVQTALARASATTARP